MRRSAAGGAAMRHEIESPFSFGDTKRTRLVRSCAAMPHRIESPFSFRLAEKKTAIHGQKKRRLGMSWPLMGQLTHTKERPVRTAGKIQKSPAGCADRRTSKNCVPASESMAFIGLQRGHPLPLFPLPLPILWGGFQRRGPRPISFSEEGFPKGRNRSFAPLCPEGVWGTVASPMFLVGV